MTEGCEDGSNGSFLVRVRAQVMKRDDSTGGWLPMGEGGLSSVSVHKDLPPCTLDDSNPIEYLISGRRISDQSEVFRCLIKKDFEYNKVMPTFHHWKTGDKKFGLTFQTAADARAFDKGVRLALMQVAEFCNGQPEDFKHERLAPPSSRNTTREGLNAHVHPDQSYEDMGDDEVFMAVDLPMEREGGSQSSTDSASTRHTPGAPAPAPAPAHAHAHAPGAAPKAFEVSPEVSPPPNAPAPAPSASDNYSYVQLTSVHHEYIYPPMEDRRDSLKKRNLDSPLGVNPVGGNPLGVNPLGGSTLGVSATQPPLPAKKKERHLICRHCQDQYTEELNGRGSCEYAPDCFRSCIDTVSCMACAHCMVYHCMSDSEGNFPRRPCECDPCGGSGGGGGADAAACGRRWVGLTLLSLLVPCLLLYPPLRGCHWCGIACGLCGSRHEPS